MMSNLNYQNFNSMFDLFDYIFGDSYRFTTKDRGVEPRFNRLISATDFPPTNIVIDKDKVLTIVVALAGYTEDNINLSFDNDYLKLVVNVPESQVPEEVQYIQRGLRKPSHVETSWMVDPRYYDRDSVETSFSNGLLTIKINPRNEVRPKKIKLFGKLDTEKALPQS